MASLRTLRDASGAMLDEALLLRFDGPYTATGEDLIEVHCHGGRAVIDAILAALGELDDLRPALPGEFTRRAFENGRIDLTEAEGLADLLEAETEAQRRSALTMAEGGLRRQIEGLQNQLLALSAQAERAIDYADDNDGESADRASAEACAALASELGQWLAKPRVEPLKEGIRVVIAGPPNAGKSSLLNALAEREHAIVTAQPGTTRDSIEVPLSIEGLPFLLIDTAGIRETPDVIEAEGVARAERHVEAADILLWLGSLGEAPRAPNRPMIVVRSKADLGVPASVDGLPVSAATGAGLGELLSAITDAGKKILPAPHTVSLNRRQHMHVSAAKLLLEGVAMAPDAAVRAHLIHEARAEFDRLTGRAGVEDLLDALFSRFCLGK